MRKHILIFIVTIMTVICSVLPSVALANDEVSTDSTANDTSTVEVPSDESSEDDETSDDVATASLPTVQCYISKDGAWTQIDTTTATGTASFSGSSRYYISAKALEDVYGKYGFSVDDYSTDSKVFGHNSTASSEWAIWVDCAPVQNGDDYNIPLIGSSSSENVRLYYMPNNKSGWPNYFASRASLSSSDTIDANSFKTLKYYVAVNGEWNELTDYEELIYDTVTEFSDYSSSSNNVRYHVSSSRLGEVYKDYGFDAESYTGTIQFAHATTNDMSGTKKIWAGLNPVKNGDVYDIALAQYGSYDEIYVYYTPNNYYGTSVVSTNATLLQKESFYTVSIEDPNNILTDDQKALIKGVDGYVFYGNPATVTVPDSDDILWKVKNKTTGESIDSSTYTKTENSNGTVTYVFSEVSEPIQIQCVSKDTKHVIINYNATLSGKLEAIGTYGGGATSAQTITNDGMVNGATSYSVTVDNDKSYDVLSPDSEYAWVTCYSVKRHFAYYFEGWKVNDTDVVIQSESEISPSQLQSYANEEGEINLTATYSLKDSNGRCKTVNFYVGLDSEIRDTNSNGFSSQTSSNFSDSVWSSYIEGTENVPQYYNTTSKYETQVLASDSASNAYTVDKKLRKSSTDPIDPGVSVVSFPSDERVLTALKSGGYSVTVDGDKVDSSNLTTENFTVRWYVLKYQDTDAWHIDGVLVAKEGKLTIKKTFTGDDTAIQNVIDGGFNITVNHGDTTDYTLTASKSLDDSSETTAYGYSDYDEETKTYTWVISGRQGRDYTVKENNYEYSGTNYSTSAEYRVTNSDTITDNNWKNYTSDSSVSVSMIAYESDVDDTAYQSVQFQNTYVKKGVVVFHKLDSTTKLGMGNVQFKLSRDSGELSLYRKPDSYQYSADSSTASDEGYTEKVSDNILVTNSTGYFSIKFPPDAQTLPFTLTEVIPFGYENVDPITLKTDASGNLTGTDTDTVTGFGTQKLTIQNVSKLLTTVMAKKTWADNVANENKLPVTVELWRDGVKMFGSEYTQVLNADNNWTYTWTNLPLFTGGGVSEYRLKEVKIGDTTYDMSEDSESGFADYTVSYADPLYKSDDETDYTHKTGYWDDSENKNVFATGLLLGLTNSEKTAEISFTKVNEDGDLLRGAVFGLYSDADCAKKIEQAKSSATGIVKFKTNRAGTYYIKEITAPDNYELSDKVYTAVIKNGAVKILDEDSNEVSQVVNTHKTRTVPLPDTGSILGAGVVLLGVVICLGAVRKKRNG